MANNSTSTMRIIGIALVIIGLGLAFWGYQTSETVGSKISHAFTGSYSNKVMAFYITGAVCFAVGIFISIKR